MSPLSSSQWNDAVAAEKPENKIVRAAIHPSIGIARVGNSVQTDGFFAGPEVADPAPAAPGFYRDSAGALKRQAARFYIYGLNAQGKVVQELTPANAEIVWQVRLANKKAAWYQFQIALDIPEAGSAPISYLRNMAIPDRDKLAIDPGPSSISGVNAGGVIFDSGKFMGKPVYLGEIRTDKAGRLLVLGGHGKAASWDGTPAVTFANNEGWHDDTSDGPVTASVKYGGQVLPVDAAWVVVAPPNYGPCQKSVRTMWDLMRDTAIKAKWLTPPACPSFDKEIRPIFERLSNLQWVNMGIGAGFGWKGPNHFVTPEWLKRLADKSHRNHELRRTIANQFRNFDRDSWSPTPWPWQYGDAMNVPAAHSPRQNVALSDTQLACLEQWAKGDFVSDYDPSQQPYTKIEDVPLAEQPDMLDRAALEFCLADAFHPGCELTWPMRQQGLYSASFRIKHADYDSFEPQYGPVMDGGLASGLLPAGPLGPQYPGGLTRWMAVPWQTDTASCRAGYEKRYDPHLPTFWPARVPNQVLTNASYEIVMDKSRPLAERLAAFARRAAWPRPLGLKNGYLVQINRMITHFGDMGVVEQRDGPGDAEFPSSLQVEDLATPVVKEMAAAMPEPDAAVDETDLTGIDKVRRFPYGLRK